MTSHRITPWLANVALTAFLVLALLAALVPKPVQAVIDSPSADPSEEIVYIDANEVIRVLDFQGSPLVQWFSPSAGWRDIALGDVNADGDLEIIALGRVDTATLKLAVFDPVVAQGGSSSQKINGIPWATYYEKTIPGIPDIVDAGNFDPGIAGDEILYGYRDAGGVTHVVILNAAKLESNGKPSGREWKVHIDKTGFENRWTYAAHGQIVDSGADEAVLLDDKGINTADGILTRFDVYNLDKGFDRADGKNSSNDTLKKVAVGQVIAGGSEEIVEARSTGAGKDSLRVFKWSETGGELTTDEGWDFSPNPDFPFLADLTGNGDQELLFLREFKEGDKGARLILLDEWGDDQKIRPGNCDNDDETLNSCELYLDSDNGYKVGAGGDVDGDGRDEIVIIRDNNIRIYKDPHRSVGSDTIANYSLSTNKDSLEIGDLDKNGFVEGPVIATDKSRVEAAVPTGTESAAIAVRLTNSASNDAIPFTAFTDQSWAHVTPNSGVTPAVLGITFDASHLAIGVYNAQLTINSSLSSVVNDPFVIELELTVEPAALQPSPANVAFVYAPCDTSTLTDTPNLTRTTVIKVNGTAGLHFNAAILEGPQALAAGAAAIATSTTDAEGNLVLTDVAGGTYTITGPSITASAFVSGTFAWYEDVPWIAEATSVTNTIPATVSLTINPGVLGTQFSAANAVMVFVADSRAGAPPNNVTPAPILALCASSQSRLPVVAR